MAAVAPGPDGEPKDDGPLEPDFPVPFSKLTVLQRLARLAYRWIWWIDCDTLLLDPSVGMAQLLAARYDGKAWGHDLGLRSPDELDPPVRLSCSCDRCSARVLTRERAAQELQFYRFRPFMIGDSGRLAGHAPHAR